TSSPRAWANASFNPARMSRPTFDILVPSMMRFDCRGKLCVPADLGSRQIVFGALGKAGDEIEGRALVVEEVDHPSSAALALPSGGKPQLPPPARSDGLVAGIGMGR